jgi:exopolyphosphatase/pppGpp-phosphohydrolase
LIAVVDVGTKSTKLVIASAEAFQADGFSWKHFIPPKGLTTGYLNDLDEAASGGNHIRIERLGHVVATLRIAHEDCRKFRVRDEDVVAFATGALRGAENVSEVLEYLYANTGMRIRVLPGLDEAQWSILACIVALPGLEDQPVTMIDQGGGSTEVATGRMSGELLKIEGMASLALGSSGLTRRAVNNKPTITVGAALEATYALVRGEIGQDRELPARATGARVIGMGGGVMKLSGWRTAPQYHGRRWGRDEVLERARAVLRKMKAEDRPLREVLEDKSDRNRKIHENASTVVSLCGGIPIVLALLDHFQCPELTICGTGLRFGVFFAKCLGLVA